MDFELADWQRAASDAFADYLVREVAPIVGAHENGFYATTPREGGVGFMKYDLDPPSR